MKPALDKTIEEIQEHLRNEQFVVFHGFVSRPDSEPIAFWDTQRRPDFREFLAAARGLGVKLIVMRVLSFQREMLDDARGRLEDSEMPQPERYRVEKQLRELQRYEGFTCSVDLLFDYQNRLHVYNLNADWYSQFLSLSSTIDAYVPFEDEEDSGDDPDDFFTRN
jgi:hypothetical protein